METTNLSATTRTILGKKVKSLRREGKLPGVVFAKNENSLAITLNNSEFQTVFKSLGESGLIKLHIDEDKALNVLISEVNQHPVSGQILHANLRKVSLKEKLSAHVPLVFEGEPAIVKSNEGILLTLMNEIEVTCLPQDIPHEIGVDVAKLNNIGDSIYVKDLFLDTEKVTLETDPEELVAKLDYIPQEVPEEAEVSEAELVEGVEAVAEKEAGEESSEATKEA